MRGFGGVIMKANYNHVEENESKARRIRFTYGETGSSLDTGRHARTSCLGLCLSICPTLVDLTTIVSPSILDATGYAIARSKALVQGFRLRHSVTSSMKN